jgi:hypothetical protein
MWFVKLEKDTLEECDIYEPTQGPVCVDGVMIDI